MPQLRQNIITGDWVVIAPERAKRPQDFMIPKSVKVVDKTKCPFCLGTESNKSNEKVRKAASENIYVLENKFPAFIEDNGDSSNRSFYPENGFYRAKSSTGDHEVVVIKDHDLSLTTMPKNIAKEMLQMIQERYLWMKKKEKVGSIMPIYNHGAEAGASIEHPHAQIFASGIVTNTVGRELDGAEKYYGVNGTCVFCDIVKHEIKEKTRIVYENSDFVSATFYAARFPFETWIYPKKHQSQFEKIKNSEIEGLTDALMETIYSLNETLQNPPLNFFIHTLPTIFEDSETFHWHIEIVPRVSNFGGYELGSGIVIDVMSPEEAADYLKGPKKGK